MKIILAFCISLKTLAVFALEERKIQIFTNDSLGIHKERALYFSPYSPIQNFPKYRDWRFLFEVGSQKKISKFLFSDFALALQGYNQSQINNMPNCFSIYGDYGLANTIYLDKAEKVQFNIAYGLSAAKIESIDGSANLSQKLSFLSIGVYGKLNLNVFLMDNLGVSISSRYRVFTGWAQSNFSYNGYEFAIMPRFAYLQLGLTYRIK
jgi:hypothetical protein